MSLRGRITLLVALVCGVLGTAPAASATVFHVHPGESIQAAIDAASPGDTIKVARGVFHENLAITTNGITLRGRGPNQQGTVLMPAATPSPSPCTSEEDGEVLVDGICIAGAFDPETFELGDPVVGTTVEGILVDGFSGFGVILLNAERSTIARVQARNNGGYGISGFVLSGIKLLHNWSHDNVEPGFYVGDSPNANADIIGNRADHNEIGIFLRDASKGLVRKNKVHDNCAGIVVLETGAPDPAGQWHLAKNRVRRNNEACEGEPDEGEPGLSGIGIALAGADGVLVEHNRVRGNKPSGESLVSGGIVIFSTADPSIGGDDPNDNRIVGNNAHNNQPFDILWDGTGVGNLFERNHCGTSDPSSICD
jgi:parallel beta-helix repeat protein